MITLTDERLGEIIRACYTALRRPDLDPRVRAQVHAILLRAQEQVRRQLA